MGFIAVVIGYLSGRKGYKVMIIVALSRRIASYFVSLTKSGLNLFVITHPKVNSLCLNVCLLDCFTCYYCLGLLYA